MKSEYHALSSLKMHPGWVILQALWAIQHKKVVEATRKSGKLGKESPWRWYAGQLEGFEIAITQLDRAIQDMEKENEDLAPAHEAQEQVEALLKKIKGEKE